MSTLQLFLLGSPQGMLDGTTLDISSNKKACALLFYLVIERRDVHRQELQDLLWGDLEENKAQTNLRITLTDLRRSKLGETPHFSFPKFGDPKFNRESIYELDVEKFEALLRPGCTVEHMQMAVALYRGDFLKVFGVQNAPRFEEWVVQQQERFHNLALSALRKLYDHHKAQRRYAQSIRYAQQALQLEPWLEEAHWCLMEAMARLGQPGAALQQYQKCKRVLAREFDVEPSKEAKELYGRIRRGEILPDNETTDEVFVIVDNKIQIPPPPDQRPRMVEHFIGRFSELNSIIKQLTQPDTHNRVALVGMGGVGKTTLATHVAHELKSHFPDGILWASDINSEPMAILENWGAAYGHDFSRIPDVEGRATAFHRLLANKRVLVVVDNVEGVARIRPLLPQTPGCAVLLTTRQENYARILQAHIFPIEELTLENGRNLLTLLLNDNRVQTEPEAADGICTLLSNLPLAIEITARRLTLSPSRRLADVADRLRQVKNLLEAEGNYEVRASFELSWGAMDLREQHIFALLGLFEGRSFTAEAVAYIAQLEKYPAEDLLIALMALSLLKEDKDRRYHQHPLLADFANEKLGANRREENGRFATYYLSFAQQHQHNYPGLRPEWSNLLAGIQLAHKEQNWPMVITFTNTLTPPWFKRGRYTDARQSYKFAIEAAQTLPDPKAEAHLLYDWGHACVEQKNYTEAQQLLLDGLEKSQKIGDEALTARIHCELARLYLETGNFGEAYSLLEASRTIRFRLEDDQGVAETFFIASRMAYFRGNEGDYIQAEKDARQALIIQEEIADEENIIPTLNLLTAISLEQEDIKTAESYAQKGLELAQKQHDKVQEALLFNLFAIIRRRQKRLEEALKASEQALQLLENMGDIGAYANALSQLCQTRMAQQEYLSALQIALRCLRLCRRIKYPLLTSYIHNHIGTCYRELNKREFARKRYEKALEIAQSLGNKRAIRMSQENLSQL